MKKRQLQKILVSMGCCFLFLINAFPFKFSLAKISVMAFLLIASLELITTKKAVFHQIPKRWFFIYILFGIFFSYVGFLATPEQYGNVLQTLPIRVVWPILYMMMIPLFSLGYYVVRYINLTLVIATGFIGLYILLGGLSYIGLLPIPQSFFVNTVQIEGKYDAVIQLADPSITSLMYLIPFVLTYYLLKIDELDRIRRSYIVVALFFSIMGMMISGRRALILNALIAPFLFYLVVRFSKLASDWRLQKKIIIQMLFMASILVITTIGAIYFDLLNFDALQDSFVQSFDLSANSKDQASEIRGSQASGLLRSFAENPIIGTGLGTGSKYVVRSHEVAGSYELSYLAILFQTGIVGSSIYFGLLIYLVWKLFKLIGPETKFIIPHLVGVICFLIANASNPYLAAFDHLWTIFLPMGIVNYCLTQNKKSW
ncbi:O-antigen ligase family protein [Sphingobacterium sp.]|uniref:O-antigen ligase family protein n=1 Tax=Sphingobacterium sp. TaxID=341027 RepID=UPI0028978C3F|nr:O-antigen ligase family protein [Sphingobacterium sp.]